MRRNYVEHDPFARSPHSHSDVDLHQVVAVGISIFISGFLCAGLPPLCPTVDIIFNFPPTRSLAFVCFSSLFFFAAHIFFPLGGICASDAVPSIFLAPSSRRLRRRRRKRGSPRASPWEIDEHRAKSKDRKEKCKVSLIGSDVSKVACLSKASRFH